MGWGEGSEGAGVPQGSQSEDRPGVSPRAWAPEGSEGSALLPPDPERALCLGRVGATGGRTNVPRANC